MLTVIIKRNVEPREIQLTQANIFKELWQINGSELLTEDSWLAGLKKVRTMYVCLVEGDCTLSANYIASNYGLMKKAISDFREGGNTRLSMISSCLGIERFDDRIYHYVVGKHTDANVTSWQYKPYRDKNHTRLYEAQVGFVPGAIIRYAAIKDNLEDIDWDSGNLVELSAKVSFYFWNTNRMLRVNPNTTYVSTDNRLAEPPLTEVKVPDRVANVFQRNGL